MGQIQKATEKNIMKVANIVFLMIALVAPQYMNAIPLAVPSQPISNNECRCSGQTVETIFNGIILGECNQRSFQNNKYYCYVDKTTHPETCCEGTTVRFPNTCINYSLCSRPNTISCRPNQEK